MASAHNTTAVKPVYRLHLSEESLIQKKNKDLLQSSAYNHCWTVNKEVRHHSEEVWPQNCILAASRRLLVHTWSKRPFPWLISISWKCSVTRMAEVVRQHSCAVLTVRLHHRSWCWTTLVSLWAAPLCLLCRADRFMFITLNREWEPIKKKVTDSHRFCVQRFPLNISRAPGNLNSLEINGSAMIDDLIGCCWFDYLISKWEDSSGV